MPATTSPATDSRILNLTAEGPIVLCEKWEVASLTVAEFNAAMRAFGDDAASHGCYNKLRGTFTFDDGEIEFRIDADAQLTEGATLANVFANRAQYFSDNKDLADLYTRASAAA